MEGDEFSDLLDKLRGGNRFTLEEFSDDEPLTAWLDDRLELLADEAPPEAEDRTDLSALRSGELSTEAAALAAFLAARFAFRWASRISSCRLRNSSTWRIKKIKSN